VVEHGADGVVPSRVHRDGPGIGGADEEVQLPRRRGG
jgi:hypothetical protein